MLLLGFVFTNVVLNQNQLDSPGLQIPFEYLAMWADELLLKIFSNAMEFNIDEANMYGFKFRSLQYEFLKHNYMFRLNYECRIIVNQLWWRNLQKKYNGPPLGSVVVNMTESTSVRVPYSWSRPRTRIIFFMDSTLDLAVTMSLSQGHNN